MTQCLYYVRICEPSLKHFTPLVIPDNKDDLWLDLHISWYLSVTVTDENMSLMFANQLIKLCKKLDLISKHDDLLTIAFSFYSKSLWDKFFRRSPLSIYLFCSKWQSQKKQLFRTQQWPFSVKKVFSKTKKRKTNSFKFKQNIWKIHLQENFFWRNQHLFTHSEM